MTSEQARRDGVADPGRVYLRNVDEGVLLTLGGEPGKGPSGLSENYWVSVEGQDAAPGAPGVQLLFGYPEDAAEKLRLPAIIVTRTDIAAAKQRWHSTGAEQARYPAQGAALLTVQTPKGPVSGYDKVRILPQAEPFDIQYTITCLSRLRGTRASKHSVNALLFHIMKKFPPYGVVWLKDSLGDWRSYDAFTDSFGPEDNVGGVTDRSLGYTMSLRVEAELDLSDPALARVATQVQIGYHQK